MQGTSLYINGNNFIVSNLCEIDLLMRWFNNENVIYEYLYIHNLFLKPLSLCESGAIWNDVILEIYRVIVALANDIEY